MVEQCFDVAHTTVRFCQEPRIGYVMDLSSIVDWLMTPHPALGFVVGFFVAVAIISKRHK